MSRIRWADLLVIIIVLRSIYVGSQRGLFGELFHILGICLAIVLGIHFYSPTSKFLNTYLFIPLSISALIGFLSISFIVYLVFNLLYGVLLKVVKIEMFPPINRIGGSILGFCKGFAISSLLFFVMLLTPIEYVTDSAKTKSLFAPFFVKAGAVLYKKSLSIFSAVKTKDLEQLLAGVRPVRFKLFDFKRKDRLKEILE